VRAGADGVETTLTLNSGYTVSLNEDQDSNPGGEVVLASPLPSGHKLVITSDVPALQSTDLTNQGGFYPEVITRALNKLTVLAQQLDEKVGRSWKVPISSGDDADDLGVELHEAARIAVEAADRVDLGALDQAVSDSQTARDEAEDAQAAAEAAQAAAEASEAQAEAARDSSFANAKGAATISDARALVADNETFIVYAADALTFDAYRRTSSSTQVFLGTYPGSKSVDVLSIGLNGILPRIKTDRTTNKFYSGGFFTKAKKVLLGIGWDGFIGLLGIRVFGTSIKKRSVGGYLFSVADSFGKLGIGIEKSGRTFLRLSDKALSHVQSDLFSLASSKFRGHLVSNAIELDQVVIGTKTNGTWTGRITQLKAGALNTALSSDSGVVYGLHWTGQSNASSAGTSVPLLESSLYPHHVVMFNTGRATTGELPPVDGDLITDFLPSVDSAGSSTSAYNAQGFAMEALSRQFGRQGAVVLARSDFHGGQPISYISPGSNAYANLITSIARAPVVSAKYGLSYRPMVFIDHGESGPQGRAVYAPLLQSLIDSIHTDAKTACGQRPDVFIMQKSFYGQAAAIDGDGVDIAQLDVAKANIGNGVHLIGPSYPYTLSDDLIHHSSIGRLMQGELSALVAQRVAERGYFIPLTPGNAALVGNKIIIDYISPSPDLQIAFDSDWLEPIENYGFSYADSGESASIMVVEITGKAQITITLSAVPTGSGKMITYAMTDSSPADEKWMRRRGQVFVSSGVRSVFAEMGYSVPSEIRFYSTSFLEILS
jgi:hypothetical protein